MQGENGGREREGEREGVLNEGRIKRQKKKKKNKKKQKNVK